MSVSRVKKRAADKERPVLHRLIFELLTNYYETKVPGEPGTVVDMLEVVEAISVVVGNLTHTQEGAKRDEMLEHMLDACKKADAGFRQQLEIGAPKPKIH